MNLFQQEDTSTFVQRFMKTCGLPFLLVLVEISSQLKQQKQFGSSVRTSSHRESSLLQPLHIWDMQIFHTCDYFLGNIEHMPTSVSHSGRPSLFSTGWLAWFVCRTLPRWAGSGTAGMGCLVWVPWIFQEDRRCCDQRWWQKWKLITPKLRWSIHLPRMNTQQNECRDGIMPQYHAAAIRAL